MASKKRYEFQIFFNSAKNLAAQELQSPAPPLKRKVIFRHSKRTVILSYTNNRHKGEITGELHSSRGKLRGIYRLISRGHSERMVIVIPM